MLIIKIGKMIFGRSVMEHLNMQERKGAYNYGKNKSEF